MFNRCPVRYQVRLGTIILLVVVVLLTSVSFLGVLKFRALAKSMRQRTYELPLAAKLSRAVGDLRAVNVQLMNSERPSRETMAFSNHTSINPVDGRIDYYHRMDAVDQSFEAYREQLLSEPTSDTRIGDIREELEVTRKIAKCLDWIRESEESQTWVTNTELVAAARADKLDELHDLTSQLPGLFQQRMETFAIAARSEYRSLYVYNLVMLLTGLSVIGFLFVAASRKIFLPLEKMIRGSRRVAEGDYDHRIELDVNGEMAVLARALNEMTASFQDIKNDLDRQVRQRTREVIRSEQMASVGFMAAGLAHEINNPLAAIAWSAESLESRFLDLLQREEEQDQPDNQSTRQKDIDVICKYLRRIQDEAFRCKNITSGLLDYSRLDDKKKQPVELVELIQSVIDMVRPLQKYAGRNIHFESSGHVVGMVNAQEMKQVALNLITNALESVPRGGNVWVSLESISDRACLEVRDDGYGLTPEVQEHLFEPFFTRRSDGSGTGLGLAITYRIIEEHKGTIVASSEGENEGATFTVQLPLVSNEQEEGKRIAA